MMEMEDAMTNREPTEDDLLAILAMPELPAVMPEASEEVQRTMIEAHNAAVRERRREKQARKAARRAKRGKK